MLKKILLTGIILLGLLLSCVSPQESETPDINVTPTPEPTPEPAPTEPIPPSTSQPDIPGMSAEEMASHIWNKLPNILQSGYTISQFDSQTKEAIYLADGKWDFQVTGTDITKTSLPLRNYEKTPGNWVQNRSREIVTCTFILTANYYENTNSLDILDIQNIDEKTSIETIDEKSIIGRGVKVTWITGSKSAGYRLHIQGAVRNIGCIPLENALIEVMTYDGNGNYLRTDTAKLSPDIINVCENGNFFLEIEQKLNPVEVGEEIVIGSYGYSFVLSSGEEIYCEYPVD